jgi:hypothetical protein
MAVGEVTETWLVDGFLEERIRVCVALVIFDRSIRHLGVVVSRVPRQGQMCSN